MAAALASRPYYGVRFSERQQAARRNPGLRVKYLPQDIAAERFLIELGYHQRRLVYENRSSFNWLLSFRHDFRAILRDRPTRGLASFLGVCPPHHPSFLVGVWLLGRCATRQTSFDIDRLPADGDPRARQHYARALRRVESWPRLRQMAHDYPQDRFVARMLDGREKLYFAERLNRFSKHVDDSHAAQAARVSQRPLWIRDSDWTVTPAKSAGWIRGLLERIREWVRGA